MQKYHVVVVGTGIVEVEGNFYVDAGALYIAEGDKQKPVIQVFAPGAWVTIFKAPPGAGLVRPDATTLAAVRKGFQS